MVDIYLADPKPTIFEWLSHYKDTIQIVLTIAGLTALIVSFRQLRNATNQRGYTDLITFLRDIEPSIYRIQEKDGENADFSEYLYDVLKLLNALDVVSYFVTKNKMHEDVSFMFKENVVHALDVLASVEEFSNRNVWGDRWPHIKILILKCLPQMSRNHVASIYPVAFGENSGRLRERSVAGLLARRVEIRRLRSRNLL